MTLLDRIRASFRRQELFPDASADELRAMYWEQIGLAESAAFDGFQDVSRSHHDRAAQYGKALAQRGEPTLPPADQD
ncbi:hypothetical protein [Microbacterium sp. SS28]|uniref:hypothetical protein n=1 Tax=Microbacterium sp. SS28 TaxID=2919948 RepID=UPI001FAA486B|nr:hypothetical protein [Microbacterium sp. SS28]